MDFLYWNIERDIEDLLCLKVVSEYRGFLDLFLFYSSMRSSRAMDTILSLNQSKFTLLWGVNVSLAIIDGD